MRKQEKTEREEKKPRREREKNTKKRRKKKGEAITYRRRSFSLSFFSKSLKILNK
jgi:hypothetical protein